MLIIELIPKMTNVFNDFVFEYGKIMGGKPEQSEIAKIHVNMTSKYAIEAIKLMIQYVDDEKVEVNFNEWMEKHGAKKK